MVTSNSGEMNKATIRERLNRDKRWCILLAWVAFAGALYGFLVLQNERFAIVAIAVFGLCIVSGMTAIRCSRCKTARGPLAMNSGSPFSVSCKIIVCPFCRAELDLPPDDPAQPEME
jgi:hypothetical protein